MSTTRRSILALLAIVTAFWIWGLIAIWLFGLSSKSYPSWEHHRFTLHPFLNSLGVAALITGALTYYWSPLRFGISKYIHGIIQTIGVAILATGLTAIFTIHTSPHFYSPHSWVGLTTTILLTFQWLGGLTLLLLSPQKPTFARVHRTLGQILLFLLLLTVLMGVQHYITMRMFGSERRDKKGSESTITGITSLLIIALVPFIHFLFQKRVPPTATIAPAPAPETYITAPSRPDPSAPSAPSVYIQ